MFPSEEKTSVRIPVGDEPQDSNRDEHAKQKKKLIIKFVTVAGITIVAFASLFFILRNLGSPNKVDAVLQNDNNVAQPFLCPEKTLKITHICEVPDLDTGPDSTMDIKVLIDGRRHWPQNREVDCLEEYGYYEDTCILPDTSLIDCFELANSREWVVENKGLGNTMKITIHETDPFFDDSIDILVSKDEWYDGDECNANEYVFNSTSTSANIRMSVSPKQAPNVGLATSSPALSPAPSPPSGSSILKFYEEKCNVPFLNVTNGLAQVPEEFNDLQNVIADYGNIARRGRDRELLWGSLVSSVAKFVGFAVKSVVSQGPLSSLADCCTIASVIKSELEPDGPDIEALFDQVNERFDAIDNKLNDIQSLLLDGFRELKVVINEAFAEQELDDWITNGHLSILQDDYKAFMNPNHTPETKLKYKHIFRKSCQETHSPYTIFKFLYSNTCSTCDKLGGRSNQYILDSFIAKANDSFDSIPDRIKSFRKGFVQLMISSMMHTFYLHSVCLYHDEGVCQNQDPVWLERFEEMSAAMEESALSMSRSEERLKCSHKYVTVKHICNYKPAWGTNCDWVSVNADGHYWPTAKHQCPSGGYIWDRPNCKISGSCIYPDNAGPKIIKSGKTLTVNTAEECKDWTLTLNRVKIPASDWYDEYECGKKVIEKYDGNTRFKIEIDSVPPGYPPSDSL
mmetsp:Transcript_504/g.756  ORF Transcript_504/g.756 Transcript_504/m.756 type:complete len:683 (-) Transcript_504:178-2226(-)